MIELNEEIRHALKGHSATPLRLMDPDTQQTFVLVPLEKYERLQAIVADDDARLMEPLLADLDPEDWEDAAAYENRP